MAPGMWLCGQLSYWGKGKNQVPAAVPFGVNILHTHGRVIAPLPLPFGEVPSQYPSIQAGLGWPRDEHLRMRRILLQVLKASFGRALST